jgi:creatinine amidohydrolase
VLMWEQSSETVQKHFQDGGVVLLPAGSTEQHGRHLPLGVDTMTALALAMDAGERAGALVAPPLWYGYSPHHMGFAGTVTLRAATLSAIVEDVLLSLVYHGAGKLIIVNGHRISNLPPLQIAATNVRNRSGAFVGIIDPIYFGLSLHRELLRGLGPDGAGHAAELETSHVMFLHPNLVGQWNGRPGDGSAPRGDVPDEHGWDPFTGLDHVIYGETPADLEGSWKVGGGAGSTEPSSPSEEMGQRLHEGLVQRMVSYIKSLQNMKTIPVQRVGYPI